MSKEKLKYFVLGMASMLAWQERGYLGGQFNEVVACSARVMRGGSCSASEKDAFFELPKALATDLCGPLKPNCQAFLRTGIH